MSVVISYVDNAISLIVTDTRLSLNDGGYDDNHEKLYDIPYNNLGYFAGVGYKALIDATFEYTIKSNNVDYEKFYTVYNFIANAHLTDEYLKTNGLTTNPIIDKTHIVYSWFNGENIEVGILSKGYTGDKKTKLINGYILPFLPQYYDNEKTGDFLKRYYPEGNYCDGDINKVLLKISQMFNEVSLNDSSVSRVIDLGLYYNKDGVLIKSRRKDSIDTIINELSNNIDIFR